MSDNTRSSNTEPQKPMMRKAFGNLSLIWLVPLVAILVGGWLIWRDMASKGPEITVSFKSAEGLNEGKTEVRYRDVNVGTVKKIELSDDFSKVKLTIQMKADLEPYLTDKTKFWVVRPRVSARGISGLETIVSGAYIEVVPNKTGKSVRQFVGAEEPQFVADGSDGTRFLLTTNNLGSLSTGAPVFLHGVAVGEVLDTDLDAAAKTVSVPIYVRAPYDKMIKPGSLFWDASGIGFDIGTQGISVHAQSLRSVVQGGINFTTPDSEQSAEPAGANTVFTLYKNRRDAENGDTGISQKFILYFDGSVRGLQPGAAVEFHGIRIGTVDNVRLEYVRRTGTFRVPVEVTIEPEKVRTIGTAPASLKEYDEVVGQLVNEGLRAQLKSSSFLTGQLYVDLDMHPLAPARYLGDGTSDLVELPTIDSPNGSLMETASALLDKLQAIPVQEIGDRVLGTVKGMEKITNSPKLTESLNNIAEASDGIKRLVDHLDTSVLPATEKALDQAGKTMTDLRDMTAPNSPVRYNLEEALKELSSAARSVRALADYLEQNPNALILGKSDKSGD
jgi:paraquat-inducible protein B